MDSEVQRIKRSFRASALWLVLLLLAMTGSTYAWFTLSGRASVNVTPMGGSISRGEAVLLISSSANGPFDKTCELVLEGNPDELRPLSTADLTHFYRAAAQNREGITILYEAADERVNQDALHGTVYLQCQNASCDVYWNPDALQLGTDAQALAAMRLGVRITSDSGVTTRIFSLDALSSGGSVESAVTTMRTNAVVSSLSGGGQAVYADDPADAISSYWPGQSALVTLAADEIAAVEYWLYLEGCDEQCINSVQNRSAQLQLAFVGEDADGGQRKGGAS